MKVSELWLREWVNPPFDGEALASQLTMAGLEVDSLHPVAGKFDKVIVAEVLETKSHPQADRLTICKVSTGLGEPLQIVCGASNVRAGLKVALAQVGATLPNDFVIKEAKLRGELSQGMLCAFSELGMVDQSEGIMELDANAPVGACLRDWLLLDDNVLDIDLTPNRGDCFSVLGIARELGALNALPAKALTKENISPLVDDILSVTLQSPEACPLYCGRIIRGIQSEATLPVFMAERLRRAGIRLIHPVVDICNYVMIETGQPMHAFDLKSIEGNLTLRFAEKDESFILLDGEKVQLNAKTLMVADERKSVAMAGIMGGKNSAVSIDTCDVFLESAFFNPLTQAGIARQYGLFTDASQRFERGVDPALPELALERATKLLLDIVGGKAGPVVQAHDGNHLSNVSTIIFQCEQVKQLTGVSLEPEYMKNILQNLGMKISLVSATNWEVQPPSWRFDINQSVDLVEEIIRIHGYDKLEKQPTYGLMQAGQMNPCESFMKRVSQWFAIRGYHETISYSFVDPGLQASLYPQISTLELLNPISSELSSMRAGLWPGLIASMIHNMHRQQQTVRIFEMGVTFDMSGGSLTEHACVGGLLMGEKGHLNWSETASFLDFYDGKGDLEALFQSLQLPLVEWVAAEHPALHPGKTAKILIAGQPAGWLGSLHPRLTDALNIQDPVTLFELNIDLLMKKQEVIWKSVTKYPHIRRDLSFLVDTHIQVGALEAVVRRAANANWFKSFDIFDVYTGKGIPEGKKSLAVALILQNPERTLVDAEINSEINAIIKVLVEEFSITLRE